MADSMKPLIIAGLVGVAGFIWYKNQNPSTGGGSSSSGSFTLDDIKKLIADAVKPATTNGGGSGSSSSGTALVDKLKAAAGGDSFNADEWNWFLGTISGRTALDSTAFGTAFPERVDPMPKMSAAEFLAKTGLSGLGVVMRRGGTPVVLNHDLVRRLVLRRAA